MSETTNLKLKKHDNPETNTEKFDIENYLNGNWDKIDKNVGEVNTNISNINLKNKEQDTNIGQLQENTETSSNKIAELEKELKEAQEDFYQNSIRGQASGEYIHVEDSSNCRARIGLSGNHEQETRSGKNLLLNDADKGTVNGITFTKDSKGIIKANGTATDAIVVYLGSKFTTIAAGTYRLSDGRNDESKDTFFTYVDCYNTDGSAYATGNLISTSDGSVKTYTESKLIKGRIVVRKGVTLNNIVFKPQLELIKNASDSATEYEQYGASPSSDYLSEVKCVGSNVNIFDGEIEKGGINYQKGNVESATDRIRSKNFIEVDPNFQYTINRLDSNGKGLGIRGYDKDKKYVGYIGVSTNKTITFIPQTYSNTDMPHPNTKFYYMKFIDLDNNLNARYKIEKGAVATGYSEYGQGSVKVTKRNKNIMPILNLGNNYKYTENGIKSLKRNDGVEVTRFKVKKGQTIKFGLKLFSRPTQDTSWTIYFDNLGIASFAHLENSSSFDLNKVYEKTYTASEDGDIFIKLWGNASSDVFEFQLWAELNTLTDYVQHEEQSYIMPTQQEMLVNDYLDYDNEEEVHVWNKKVLDGTEEINLQWDASDKHGYRIVINDIKKTTSSADKSLIISNSYKTYIQDDLFNLKYKASGISNRSNNSEVIIRNDDITTITEFKAYLKSQYDAGTPVMIYYKLQTPTKLAFTEEQKAVAKELNNARTYKNVTNITTDSKAILSLDYAKDLETLLNNTQALAVNNASEGV